MVPCGDYVRLRQAYIDPVENEELIKKSNEYHFTVAANVRDTIKKAQELGIKTWITLTAGTDIVMCDSVNGDGIVDVTHSSVRFVFQALHLFLTGMLGQQHSVITFHITTFDILTFIVFYGIIVLG